MPVNRESLDLGSESQSLRGLRPLALFLNKDTGSRAQPCSSTQGSNLQSAVHWAYLLEANFNQAAFCDFLMDFVNHTLFIVLRWLSQPGSLRRSQDQMVEQRPIKTPIKTSQNSLRVGAEELVEDAVVAAQGAQHGVVG